MTGPQPGGGSLFDVFVMVDWSAASRPRRGRDSIWSASLDVRTGMTTLHNHPTRRAAESALRTLLCSTTGATVLVGVDVPFGYPVNLAAGLVADRPEPVDWKTVWRHLARVVRDDERNHNNRFQVASDLNVVLGGGPGPFWGCPADRATPSLHPRKVHEFPMATAAGPLQEFRLTEQRLRARGRYPLATWQTHYTGSVGSQALLAIPVIDRLVRDPGLSTRAHVWPFTTGLTADPVAGRCDAVVFAEVWPGCFDLDVSGHEVRDAAQMVQLCSHVASLDRCGALGALFEPRLTAGDADVVVRQEGWILGC